MNLKSYDDRAAATDRNFKFTALGQELIARDHRDDHSAGRIDDQDPVVEFRELMALNERHVAGDAGGDTGRNR